MRKILIVFVFIALMGANRVSTLECHICKSKKSGSTGCKGSKTSKCDSALATKYSVIVKDWDPNVDPNSFDKTGGKSCVKLENEEEENLFCTWEALKVCEINMVNCEGKTLEGCGWTCLQCTEDKCNEAGTFFISGYIWLVLLLSHLPIGILYT